MAGRSRTRRRELAAEQGEHGATCSHCPTAPKFTQAKVVQGKRKAKHSPDLFSSTPHPSPHTPISNMLLLKVFFFAIIILALAFALLGIRLFFGKHFVNSHVGANKHLQARGIHCMQAQDAEMRAANPHKVNPSRHTRQDKEDERPTSCKANAGGA